MVDPTDDESSKDDEDFAALLAESEVAATGSERIKPGDLVRGRVVALGTDTAFVTFRYMDGAAELYRSFAFRLLMVRRYMKSDSPPVIAEFFDMGSSQDAFGIFTFETGGEDVGVSQGSDHGGGLLRFWQGKFFVNVYAEQETPSTKQDVLEIAKAIARSLGQEGQKPKLIHYLPQEGLSERSIRYFHLHQSLNYHYFVSHENILRLGEKTNAALASYLFPQTQGKTFLLIIQYPSQKMAGEVAPDRQPPLLQAPPAGPRPSP